MSIIDDFEKDQKLEEIVFFLAERMMHQSKVRTKVLFKQQDIDITKDQWVVLKHISQQNGIMQATLAHNTFKDPAAITRILDILVKKGLVVRTPRPDDRRVFEIYLSKKGIALVKKALPFIQDLRKTALKGLSKTDIKVIKKGLRKIHDNLL